MGAAGRAANSGMLHAQHSDRAGRTECAGSTSRPHTERAS